MFGAQFLVPDVKIRQFSKIRQIRQVSKFQSCEIQSYRLHNLPNLATA